MKEMFIWSVISSIIFMVMLIGFFYIYNMESILSRKIEDIEILIKHMESVIINIEQVESKAGSTHEDSAAKGVVLCFTENLYSKRDMLHNFLYYVRKVKKKFSVKLK